MAGHANVPLSSFPVLLPKPAATFAEIAILSRLARSATPTCTTVLGGFLKDGHVPLLTDTGLSLEKHVALSDGAPLEWTQLHADVACAARALAALGLEHDDLTAGAARNITVRDGRYFVIDFGAMAVRGRRSDAEFASATLTDLARWLVRYAGDFVRRTNNIPAEYIAGLAPDEQRLLVQLQRPAPDMPVPPQRRIKLQQPSRSEFDALALLRAVRTNNTPQLTLLARRT